MIIGNYTAKIGIYKIQSKIHPERIYIGSSVNIHKRLNEHKRKLFLNKHDSPKLQDHFNKYFWQDLDCSIIEECQKEILVQREQYYIDVLNPWFNICKVAGNCLYKKHTEETKRKLKIARNKRSGVKGWHHSEETKKKWSEKRKGIKQSKETIEKRVSKTRGRKRSEEFKKRLSEMKMGEKNYAYGKPAHNRGSHHTEESKLKMSISHKNITEESRENMRQASKRRKRNPHSHETIMKISRANKGKHLSPKTEFKKGHKYILKKSEYGKTG
jgi:group I intron endonuclease